MAGLVRHGGQRGAGSFRLDDTDRFAIDEQEVVASAGFERDFAKSDPLRRFRGLARRNPEQATRRPRA